MKPNQVLALCAFLDATIQLFPFVTGMSGVFSITGAIGILISVALLWKDKFSFKAYRFYLWINFIATLLFVLIVTFGNTHVPKVKWNLFSALGIPPALTGLLWVIISAALLYYTETDKVRRTFKLPPKKRSLADDSQHDDETVDLVND